MKQQKESIAKYVRFINKRAFFKFCIVGCCATALDMSVYFILLEIMGPLIAKTVSMGCSMILSYNLNRQWSFLVKVQKTSKEFLRFSFSQLINISVNVGTNYLVLVMTQLKLVAFIVATAIAMSINYALQKFWVFRSQE